MAREQANGVFFCPTLTPFFVWHRGMGRCSHVKGLQQAHLGNPAQSSAPGNLPLHGHGVAGVIRNELLTIERRTMFQRASEQTTTVAAIAREETTSVAGNMGQRYPGS